MMTEIIDGETSFQNTRIDSASHDVEEVLHEAEEAFSHVTPMCVVGVVGLLSIVVLMYRLLNG